jgi:hypothetical protein
MVSLMNFAFDIRKLLLHEAGSITHTLVVHGRTQLANKEVEQTFCTKVADRLVELVKEALLDRADKRARRSSDSWIRIGESGLCRGIDQLQLDRLTG